MAPRVDNKMRIEIESKKNTLTSVTDKR